MKPTPQSEAAWASLIPVGRGFVHHPKVAPYKNSIAHGIRVSYYNMLHQLEVLDGGSADEYLEQSGAHATVGHLRHCFDYLRRALMCAADTNLEVVNPDTSSTTGWGYERKCRDYESVMKWAALWANSTDAGIV
ncbi:Tat pathway signal sequence protein [Rutstroemia sp. NJR-2017a WRK4]|nr:Tat pathway signal sequence protein [Rutstroemia sp. NJR-2017a WRK4]